MPDLTSAGQIAWQRQAHALLGRLLELAAKQDLPAIRWTVQEAGAGLSGESRATPHALRREHFAAWKTAITQASGHEPDHGHEHTFSGGETRLVCGWRRLPVKLGAKRDELYPTVNVTLAASIWADDEDQED